MLPREIRGSDDVTTVLKKKPGAARQQKHYCHKCDKKIKRVLLLLECSPDKPIYYAPYDSVKYKTDFNK